MHSSSGPRRRRSDELEAKVLAACEEPEALISGVALAHGPNANLVRKWRCGRGLKHVGMAITPAAIQAPRAPLGAAPEFDAVEMPASSKAAASATRQSTIAAPIAKALIQIELHRGPLHLNVRWPTAAADDCRAWLSELYSGLLK